MGISLANAMRVLCCSAEVAFSVSRLPQVVTKALMNVALMDSLRNWLKSCFISGIFCERNLIASARVSNILPEIKVAKEIPFSFDHERERGTTQFRNGSEMCIILPAAMASAIIPGGSSLVTIFRAMVVSKIICVMLPIHRASSSLRLFFRVASWFWR